MRDYPLRTTQQLSSHLRSLRKRLGLTQAQLGTRLGVEQARIAKIERHPGSISVERLLQLLAALESELLVRPKVGRSRASRSRAIAEPKTVW